MSLIRRRAVAAGAAVALLVTACDGSTTPTSSRRASPAVSPEAGAARLAFAGPFGPSMDAIAHVASHEHVSVGSVVVCLVGGKSVQVRAVEPIDQHHIAVAAVAVRPAPTLGGGDLLGEGYGVLADNGFPPSVAIEGSCTGQTRHLYEVGIEFVKTASASGNAPSFDILYGSPGTAGGRLHVPYSIYLCSGRTSPHGCV